MDQARSQVLLQRTGRVGSRKEDVRLSVQGEVVGSEDVTRLLRAADGEDEETQGACSGKDFARMLKKIYCRRKT